MIVYKLGGSLLDLPDLADRLRAVWQNYADSPVLLVVGGGTAADVVRDWDRTHQLGDEAAHWLAIEALELSAKLVENLVPELRLVRSLGQMRAAHASGHPAVLCVKCFVKWLDTQPQPLPHRWDVTTDSIAAAVSAAWNAGELVLLKSRDMPPKTTTDPIAGLVADGAVDGYFSDAAVGVETISWINLRAEVLRVQCVRKRDDNRH